MEWKEMDTKLNLKSPKIGPKLNLKVRNGPKTELKNTKLTQN